MSTDAERRIEHARQTGATSLDLSNLKLSNLPESVMNVCTLADLDLSFNNLSVLPESLSSLPSLSWLDLSRNNLTELPGSLQMLSSLTWLDLSRNKFVTIPIWLGELRSLEWLDLSHNSLRDLPDTLGRLSSLVGLDISFNDISALPESLGQLNLEWADMSNNMLSTLPDSLRQLSLMATLDLSFNVFLALPEWLGELGTMTRLYLSDNGYSVLPDSVSGLMALTELHLSNNRILELPEALGELPALQKLSVDGNPLAPELLVAAEYSHEELLSLLRLLPREGVWLREMKVIFAGEGEAGKSSLLAAMLGEPWVPNRTTTHGLEIKHVTVPSGSGDIQLNGWDFGGQPVYRPTHQLFFTAPAVYLVVWNPRRGPDVSFVDFWIELIQHRAGSGARIHVVATHAGVAQRGAWIDEARLRERFGDMIAGFHHIDSQSGLGIPELMDAIGATAAEVPHVNRRYPESWLRLREAIRDSGRPYLTYDAYEKLATGAGLTTTSARSLAISSNALGHWIYYSDEPDLANLIIFKPDWLSTAMSLVLDDPVTRAANGLLAHRRLTTIWNDPARPAEQRYPTELHAMFLYLMEKFEISYRVTYGARHDEPTSLVAQLVGSSRPDLSAAWDGYGTRLEERTYVCEMVDDERNAVTPTGLMYRLIVRFHRYSLGRFDHAESRHWQHGLVLDNDLNGRALLTLDRKRLTIRVRAAFPEHLLHRLSEEIREHNEQFWPGLTTRILVPCGEGCGRNRPGSGLFDVERLTRERTRGHTESACEYCPEFYDIDALLRAGALRVGREPQGLTEAVLDAFRQNADLIVSEIHGASRAIIAEVNTESRRNLDAVELLGVDVQRAISRAEEHYRDLMLALDDEGRDGPRLFTVDSPRTLNPTRYRLRVTLWCEHSRLPVPAFSAGRGVYDLELPREWVVKAAPWLKVTLIILRGLLPVVAAGIDLAQPDPQAWQRVLSAQLQHAERSVGALGDGVDLAAAGPAVPDGRPARIGRAGPVELDSGLVRTLRAEIGKQDPGYGGLERVRTHTGYRWVHPRFVSHYRLPLPEIPTDDA